MPDFNGGKPLRSISAKPLPYLRIEWDGGVIQDQKCEIYPKDSQSIVRYVAGSTGDLGDLGEKGSCGILQSVRTRVEFLTDTTHRIQFIYTLDH